MRYLHTLSILTLTAACGGDKTSAQNSDATGGGLSAVSAEGTASGEGTVSGGQEEVGASADASGSTTGTSAAVSDDASVDGTADDGRGPHFDVGSPDGGAACGGGTGGGEPLHSNIWIANSSEGTVSKINTQSMVEEGRYIVKPNSAGSPSRTSVSLSADVAVANRNGGVAKIYGNIEQCQESNGTPGIQTSAGSNILAWGEEECIAWYTDLQYSSNRPMAWAQGEFNETTCAYENEKLWTAGANGAGLTQVLLLDGDTGVVEQTIDVPEVLSSIGLYGGAVDGDGHFWGIDRAGVHQLLRVDRNDFSYQLWDAPSSGYGIAVDSVGRPWFCAGGGASRFDPVLETWQTLASPGGNLWGGCMTDGEGTLWHCRQQDSMLVGIDTETLAVVQQIPLPAYAHGISIDFSGYVWAVGFTSTQAFRVDPATGTIDMFSDLVGAYSYSDMTGFALSTAGVPSR